MSTLEIERKFLINSIPSELESSLCHQIEQGYLSYDPEIRIRKKDELFFLTIKIGEGLSRFEKEIEISEREYQFLSGNIKSRQIKKERYDIPLGTGLCAELDVYKAQLEGLAVVEVEFLSEDQANLFDKPEWFGIEITLDKKYKNKSLSLIDRWNG